MIVEYARVEIPHGLEEQFEARMGEAAADFARSEHCIEYELSRCRTFPSRYTLRIVWDSIEGHLEGFRENPAFAGYYDRIEPFRKYAEETQHYEVTGVAGRGGAPG